MGDGVGVFVGVRVGVGVAVGVAADPGISTWSEHSMVSRARPFERRSVIVWSPAGRKTRRPSVENCESDPVCDAWNWAHVAPSTWTEMPAEPVVLALEIFSW